MPAYLAGKQIVIGNGCFVAMALIAVLARLAVRFMERQRHLILSDIWLVIAVSCSIGLWGMSIWLDKLGAFEDMLIFLKSKELLRAQWVITVVWTACAGLPRLSMLAFYYQIIPETSQKTRTALHILTIYVVGTWVFLIFASIFWCGTNLSNNYSITTIIKGECSGLISYEYLYTQFSLQFSSELFLFLLPLPVVMRLHLNNWADRICIFVTFTIGAATLAVALGRFVTLTVTRQYLSIYIWSGAELSTAITVAAMTALRPLLRRIPCGRRNKPDDLLVKDHPRPPHGSAASWNDIKSLALPEGVVVSDESDKARQHSLGQAMP